MAHTFENHIHELIKAVEDGNLRRARYLSRQIKNFCSRQKCGIDLLSHIPEELGPLRELVADTFYDAVSEKTPGTFFCGKAENEGTPIIPLSAYRSQQPATVH